MQISPEKILPAVSMMRERFAEIETQLSDQAVFSKPAECKKLSRERARLSVFLGDYDKWCATLRAIAENKELAEKENDEDFKRLAISENEKLKADEEMLQNRVKSALIPPEPNDGKDAIVEIRPAAGGEEASLFASEMFRMYAKFAEINGWKIELLDLAETGLGGIKEVIFSLAGDNVFSQMKFESGVHRVQRVPVTESGGRIHTSTITVVVLPEAEELEIEIKPADLRIDFFRSSGPGGQNVNRTDSAVRITHIPSGISVACQQEKSQHRNRDTAMRILRARMLEAKQLEEAQRLSESKKSQIGSGERNERIRTYNFPQNRVTDHRYGVSIHDLPGLLEGKLESLLSQILLCESEKRLSELVR